MLCYKLWCHCDVMIPRGTNWNRGVSAKEYSVCITQCVIQYYSVVFSIIKYCEFSDIKELVDQVFSDPQLAHGIAVGTTISFRLS